ncbi:DNA-processing protein DprA [Gordonia sinesedis]
MTDDAQRRAWAYLARVAEPPCGPLRALVADLGPLDAADAVRRRVVPAGYRAVLEPTEARADIDSAAEDLAIADRMDARLVTPDDAEWPAWSLLPLGRADTASRGGEPLALWVRGPGRLDDVGAASIGLVGARAASPYGEHVTTMLAEGLAIDAWSIVSGAAYGIDGVAHRAALGVGGGTLAVMACGIDRDYPAGHSRLLAEIADRGVIATEYPPGTGAAKHRFLTRNRLVAAMSSAVVVVEAGRRSGAANTAAWARKLGRPLGAVPGPITSATSVGCHRMIADHQATLIADVASAVALACPDGADPTPHGHDRPTDTLTPDQQRVHDALPGRGAVTIDEIAYSAGLDTATVRAALSVLDLGGHVTTDDGASWRLVRAPKGAT